MLCTIIVPCRLNLAMYTCSVCNYFGGQSFSAVLRHMGEIHRYDPNLRIRCGIDCCPQSYTNFDSFRSHVYRKHRDVLKPITHNSTPEHATGNLGPELQGDTDPGSECTLGLQSQTNVKPDPRVCGAKFLLQTREQYHICQASLNRIAADVKGLWTISIESLKASIEKSIAQEAPAMNIDAILECVDDFATPLDGLETEYRQTQFYKEHFHYIVGYKINITINIMTRSLQEPNERLLGRYMREKNGKYEEVKECCYEISLIDSLQRLLCMDTIREQVLANSSMFFHSKL